MRAKEAILKGYWLLTYTMDVLAKKYKQRRLSSLQVRSHPNLNRVPISLQSDRLSNIKSTQFTSLYPHKHPSATVSKLEFMQQPFFFRCLISDVTGTVASCDSHEKHTIMKCDSPGQALWYNACTNVSHNLCDMGQDTPFCFISSNWW